MAQAINKRRGRTAGMRLDGATPLHALAWGAALAALLASGAELQAAVGEALAFMDQTLDAGFRPGMGAVVPDRFFWALPPAEDGEPGAEAPADEADTPDPESTNGKGGKPAPRRVH